MFLFCGLNHFPTLPSVRGLAMAEKDLPMEEMGKLAPAPLLRMENGTRCLVLQAGLAQPV